jgi:hypothetical protein
MIEPNNEGRQAAMAVGERAKWIEPSVRRINAGAAELNTAGSDDGVDLS